MTTKHRLQEDLQHAIRNRDDARKRTLRLALAEVKNREVEVGGELGEDDVAAVLLKQANQRRDTLNELRQANRPDLVALEQEELDVLKEYLPQQLGRDEIGDLANQVIVEVDARGPQHMGKVMQSLMPRVKGQADGKLVNQIVRELLNNRQ